MSQLTIRTATIDDWLLVVEIEGICFPAAEAASPESLRERLSVYPEGCLIAEIDQKIIGFINGGSTNDDIVEDAFYASMNLHDATGCNLAIFGLAVSPDYQSNGYARELMNRFITLGRGQKKSAILLTCKTHLCRFYESFGYENLGLSASTHGAAQWYEMRLEL